MIEKKISNYDVFAHEDRGHASDIIERYQRRVLKLERHLANERHTRFSETAALTRRLEELRKKLLGNNSSQRDLVSSLEQSIQELEAQKEELNQRIEDIMNSTSWRVTLPMRWLKDLISPRRQ